MGVVVVESGRREEEEGEGCATVKKGRRRTRDGLSILCRGNRLRLLDYSTAVKKNFVFDKKPDPYPHIWSFHAF